MSENKNMKAVPGYPGYFVSVDGRVFSTRRYKNPRELKANPNANGYRVVALQQDGEEKTRKVSQLVLEAFVGPRPSGMHSLHGPGGNLDDSLSNLSWGTPQKNHNEDRIRDGTTNRGSRNVNVKLASDEALAIYHDSRKNPAIAKAYGVSTRAVWSIKHGVTWAYVTGHKRIEESRSK